MALSNLIALFIIIVLAILLVIANFVGKSVAENDMADQFTANGFPIKPSVNIKYPWFLTIGDHSWIGERAWLDCTSPLKIGKHVFGLIQVPDQDQAPDLQVSRIRGIQAAHPNTPLIAISAQFRSGLSAAGAAAQTLGVQQVIAKPLVRAHLLEAVRAMTGAPD